MITLDCGVVCKGPKYDRRIFEHPLIKIRYNYTATFACLGKPSKKKVKVGNLSQPRIYLLDKYLIGNIFFMGDKY